jgi:hypothetical protein
VRVKPEKKENKQNNYLKTENRQILGTALSVGPEKITWKNKR